MCIRDRDRVGPFEGGLQPFGVVALDHPAHDLQLVDMFAQHVQQVVFVAINGCKELHQLIKEQQAKIEALETRLSDLETKTN